LWRATWPLIAIRSSSVNSSLFPVGTSLRKGAAAGYPRIGQGPDYIDSRVGLVHLSYRVCDPHVAGYPER
jgi:hypothetical protein